MKILFIGNSHTYMNDMPELVREMVENACGETCEVVMLAYSGKSLQWHMEEYFSERFNILHGRYDYCVIQEQAHPMPEEEATSANLARLIELCKKVNTTPVLFETWAEKRKPENQAGMNQRYQALAKEYDARLAPVGEVWTAAKEKLNALNADLYYRDGAHASAVGDYLIAMVLTKVITGKLPSPEFRKAFHYSLPGNKWMPVIENVADEVIEIEPEVAEVIRKLAAELA